MSTGYDGLTWTLSLLGPLQATYGELLIYTNWHGLLSVLLVSVSSVSLLPPRQLAVTFPDILPHSPIFQYAISELLFKNHLEFIDLETLFFKKFPFTVGKGLWLPLDPPLQAMCVGL